MNDQSMHDLSKAVRRVIRELAGLAYERELTAELTKLRAEFDAWSAGQITPFELQQIIHEFHDGVSRQLFNRYTSGSKFPHVVAAAVMRGTISVAEIPDPARKQLDRLIASVAR
jgi:hypothetical protein